MEQSTYNQIGYVLRYNSYARMSARQLPSSCMDLVRYPVFFVTMNIDITIASLYLSEPYDINEIMIVDKNTS